ncbi:MAG: (2Fe-2S)-binding protein, partial [Parvularculaceae bacterium]|nr:(2Fe-2S)-binding protein [Parvularculaceae bacterium]
MKSVRLPRGGDVNRDKRISFSFDGKSLEGFEGDTLASALIANGVAVVGRSFKYHRPRGLMAAGVEEPNALVSIGAGARREVNLRATEVELTEGISARAVNCWPNARIDVGAVNNLIAQFIPAGFYYKTFMLPGWRFYEPFIRRAAGLGKPSDEPDPDIYDATYAHTDILIVGTGPAGLAAARAAAGAGVRVMLVEQDAFAGGSLRWQGGEIDGRPARDWADEATRSLAATGDIRFLARTTAVGYFDHNELALLERLQNRAARMRLWRVRARQVILAAGAIERPLVFPGNDRPGVMLASGIRRYLGQFAVRAGE